MPSQALEIEDLCVTFGQVRAVDKLSMTAPLGQVTAVLGVNGAGKTTTIETAEGYRRPATGQVRVLGLDPVSDARALRPRMGVMLQSDGVPSGARAIEVLRYSSRLYAHPMGVDALAARLDIASLGGRSYRRLSGGEKQRVKLALALIGRPELVFLDEPTAGLDPAARASTWELVQELRSDGVSVVLTTHLLDEAEHLADHVVIIHQGSVVASGAPAELTGDDDTSWIRFSGPAGLDLDGLRTLVPPEVSVDETSHGRYQVQGQLDPQLIAAVTAWCARNQVAARGLQVGGPSLQDVFLRLTSPEPPT